MGQSCFLKEIDYKSCDLVFTCVNEKIKLLKIKFKRLNEEDVLNIAIGFLDKNEHILKLKKFTSLSEDKFLMLCKEIDLKE